MKFINKLDFFFKPQSSLNFSNLCEITPNDLNKVRGILSKMPNDEVLAFKLYAEQRSSIGASIWAQAELHRREFLFNQTALIISLLAFFISLIALVTN